MHHDQLSLDYFLFDAFRSHNNLVDDVDSEQKESKEMKGIIVAAQK